MAGWVGGKSGELDGQQHRGKSFMYLNIFKTVNFEYLRT